MPAIIIYEDHKPLSDREVVHMKIWRVPVPVFGSTHIFKYSMVFVVDGLCVLRYDNERGKGDHRHIGNVQYPYIFTTPTKLLADFLREVESCRN